ncbi:hypothetical protein J6Z19_04300 [bacterium]|nr:hypothetical protein [bacterium]
MKKLILAFFSVVFIASAIFFFSFSSFSEDDGCVVVLNSFKSGLSFDDLVFKESDNAEKCNKNNTLILYTPEEKSALEFVKPLKKRMDKVSFFVSAVVPEKRAEDPAITFSEHRSNDVKAPETDPSEKAPVSVPDKESDFVIYYLYNDPDSSNEELDDALLDIQKSEVNLILTGSYSATEGKNLRHRTLFLESNEKPEFSVLVFSILRLENGAKKVIIRSFSRRTG